MSTPEPDGVELVVVRAGAERARLSQLLCDIDTSPRAQVVQLVAELVQGRGRNKRGRGRTV
jgi:hypothetical protein